MKTWFHHRYFWHAAIPVYGLILALTMVKDLYFTGNQPNILFYLLVPAVGLFGAAGTVYLFLRLLRRDFDFSGILKIFFISDFIMQIWENLAKIVYYTLWQYPGILWFAVFPLAFTLTAYLFVRIYKTNWKFAYLLAVIGFASSVVFGLLFTALTGIETPGS